MCKDLVHIDGVVHVHARVHPIRDERVYARVNSGQSISQIIGGSDKPVLAWLDGELVHPKDYALTFPAAGSYVHLHAMPGWEGFVMFVKWVVGVYLGTTAAHWAVAFIVRLAVNAALAALASYLIGPPDQPNSDASSVRRYNSLTGVRNQLRPFGVVPRLYGHSRYYPPIPMTALPFTEVKGNDQYTRLFLVLGYGPLDFGGLRADSETLVTGRTRYQPGVMEYTLLTDVDPPTTVGDMSALADIPTQMIATEAAYNLADDDTRLGERLYDDRFYWSQNQAAEAPDEKPSFLPDDNYAFKYTTQFYTDTTGTHEFGLDTVRSADLYIDAEHVVGRYSATTFDGTSGMATGSKHLEKGMHTMVLRFASVSTANPPNPPSDDHNEGIALYWKRDGNWEIISKEQLNQRHSGPLGDSEDMGPLGSTIFVGDTPISQLEDVEVEVGDPEQFSLYTTQVLEDNPNVPLNIQDNSTGNTKHHKTRKDDISTVHTTEADTEEVSLDLSFPSGLWSFSSSGYTTWAQVKFLVEYAPTGTGSYVLAPNYQGFVLIKDNKRKAFRENISFKVPKGQYDVRVTRQFTTLARDASFSTNAVLTAFRSIRSSVTPFIMDGVVCMAIKFRATNNFQGTIDRVGVQPTSILPVWDGDDWVEQPTSNPAWHYADVHVGTANRRPLDRDANLNRDELLDWADNCDAIGLGYNGVFDGDNTVFDAAKEVAGTGRGAWALLDDGRVSVVQEKFNQTPAAIITPRNSRNFQMQRNFVQAPQALRVAFVDPNTWEDQERFVFNDGFNKGNAERYDQHQTRGVTSSDQAWLEGRYYLAQIQLRPESYTWEQDIRNLVYRRGDTVLREDDVIQVGIAAGRVLSTQLDGGGDVVEFTGDEFLPMDAGTDYAVRVQRDDGTVLLSTVENVAPGTKTVTLDTPLTGVKTGDHFLFGESGIEALALKVVDISFDEDFQATVQAVPEAPGIEDAVTGAIPAWNPQQNLSTDPDLVIPPVPTVEAITSDDKALIDNSDGGSNLRVVVEFSIQSNLGSDARIETRYRDSDTIGGTWLFAPSVDANSGAIVLGEVFSDRVIDIQLRTVRGNRVSAWTDISQHLVLGKVSPPLDVSGFTVSRLSAKDLLLSWDENQEPDIAHYEIQLGDVWDDQAPLVRIDSSNYIYRMEQPGTFDFMIKAVDTTAGLDGPNKSASEATTQAVITDISQFDEFSASPGTEIFDGTDEGVWQELATVSLEVLFDNQPVVLYGSFKVDVTQISPGQTQAGPGGPNVFVRVVRDKGLPGELIIEELDAISVSTVGLLEPQIGSQADDTASAGNHTYTFEAKWEKTTYDAGTVDIAFSVDANGDERYDITGSGTLFASSVNGDWEIEILESGWSGPQLKLSEGLGSVQFQTGVISQTELVLHDEFDEWPDSNLAGANYEITNAAQALTSDLVSYWIQVRKGD